MCKKLFFLISFVLVLGLVGNASAEDDVYWTDSDPCDHLWSSPNNWSVFRCPKSIDPESDLGDCAYIQPDSFTLEQFPIVDDSVIKADPNTGSHPLTVIVGVWSGGDAYMTMTGGYIHTDWEVVLGLHKDANATLNMSGGLIELEGSELFIGDGGIGHLNMTGGVIDTNGGLLALPGETGWLSGSGGGTGIINLDAGTIDCNSLFMQAPSTIDINEGTLIIQGNATGVVTGYVESGWITGRGSTDPRNTKIVYDDVNDITIVTYDPTPDLTLPWRPRPLPGSTDASWKPTLSWQPGQYAAKHTVYFGSSLSDANESATPVSANQVGTTYPINYLLEFGQTYYWRIDEVNEAGPDPCLWPGAVWFFTVGDYVVVDDFDSYASTDILNDIWHDYDTAGGGVSGQGNAEVILQTITVHDGNSMEYRYNNLVGGGGDKERFSESWANTADLAIGPDWTGGAKALVLYFYGDPCNAADPVYDRMWVALEDGSGNLAVKNYAGDMNDIKKEEWQEWNIKLQDFNDINDVNLASVSKVYIGFGVRAVQGVDGTNGTVYFDDIRVYPTRCVDESAPAGDVTGECLVDYADVNALARDWLLSDYNIVATAPNSAVGWWKLDEGADTTAADSCGTNDGTLGGQAQLPKWLDDCGDPCHSPCLDFDGVGYVNVPPAAFTNVNDEITVTLWQYGTMTPAEVAHVMFQAHDACDPYDLTVKGELWYPSATGCDIYFDAGYGGDLSVDSVMGRAGLNDYQGQWNHYAFTKNANTGEMKIYLNGVLFADQGEESMDSPVTGTEITLFKIGSDADGGRRYDGYMSDFRLYNYALTYGEVRHVAGQMDPLYIPLPNPDVDLHEDGKVNFKDYVVLANTWLVETLWP